MDPLLDRYELRDRLGRGGMATVYRAYDRQLGRFVAIKLFPAGTAADDTRRRGEATALARLSHPHLVTLFDAHLAGDGETTPSFLVMELVDGQDLRSRLDEGPLPPEQVATLTADVAEALAVVHGAGMVHRDLKPANILLATSSVPGRAPIVKLADFGIAHLLGADRVTTAGTVIGTAGYLSPEQLRGADPGPAADVYAFGLVVLEALTGVRQYPGTPVEAVAARAAHDPSVPADLPDGWRGMLLAMTSADQDLRPTAAEVATMAAVMGPELAGWVPVTVAVTVAVPVAMAGDAATVAMPAGSAGAGATAPTQPVAAPPHRRRRLATVLVAAGAAVVVAGALALGALLAPGGETADTGPTPRPTPSVQTPPQTVAPAVVPSPAPAPAQETTAPDDGNTGPGNNGNGKGNGNGNKGKGKG
ncbi:serine/threonine-protein kinase [Leifsonia aquatica]|uniref:serine/threonine-protein kinase n=1 Tax=Leifsonia aquatica TaxID=144185 RepID=UPI003827A097